MTTCALRLLASEALLRAECRAFLVGSVVHGDVQRLGGPGEARVLIDVMWAVMFSVCHFANVGDENRVGGAANFVRPVRPRPGG